MEFLGTDADFSPKAEFEPISEPGGSIHIHRCCIHQLLELPCICVVIRHNGFRMAGTIAADVFTASSRLSTTFTESRRSPYSVAQSSSVAGWTSSL